MTQIAMDLSLPPSYQLDDFVVSSSNRLAYEAVIRWPVWDTPFLWIYGPPASGKTHLLHILSQRSRSPILEGDLPKKSSEELFIGNDLLILDNVSVRVSEETLFHAMNFAKNHQKQIIFVHELPPSRVPVALPDLESRLRSVTAVAIHEPDDMVLQAVMVKQLADRQLTVSSDVIHYILKRIDRSCLAVHQLVERMDKASLEQGRTITLPFIKSLFTSFCYE